MQDSKSSIKGWEKIMKRPISQVRAEYNYWIESIRSYVNAGQSEQTILEAIFYVNGLGFALGMEKIERNNLVFSKEIKLNEAAK